MAGQWVLIFILTIKTFGHIAQDKKEFTIGGNSKLSVE
jgi:hypothetical protein